MPSGSGMRAGVGVGFAAVRSAAFCSEVDREGGVFAALGLLFAQKGLLLLLESSTFSEKYCKKKFFIRCEASQGVLFEEKQSAIALDGLQSPSKSGNIVVHVPPTWEL